MRQYWCPLSILTNAQAARVQLYIFMAVSEQKLVRTAIKYKHLYSRNTKHEFQSVLQVVPETFN